MVAAKESLEVVYNVSPDDAGRAFREVNRLFQKRAKAKPLRGYRFMIRAIYTAIGVSLFFILQNSGVVWPIAAFAAMLLSIALTCGGGWLIYWLQLLDGRKKFVALAMPTEGRSPEQIAIINAEGIFKHSSSLMVTFFWHYISDIVMTESTITFLMDPDRSPNLLFIPRRAFDSDDAAKEYFNLAVALKKEAALTEAAK